MEENYRRYPIGIQNFEQLRNRNCVYVDKTELVYRLANTDSVYFLSRPRRFGKSLLVSTLEAYFQGKKDLFKGLAMERLEKDWNVYPVFHIDFSLTKYTTLFDLQEQLNLFLLRCEKVYGAEKEEKTPAARLQGMIRRAYEQTSSESFTTDIERHMIVKVPSDKPALTAYAVANLTQTTADKLLACTTIADIQDVELAEHPNFLVKVGEQPIGSYKTTTQLATHDDGNCNKITIPVSQRVAAFELASFKVVDTSKEKVDGEYPVVPNVEVVSVQMLNIKLSAKVVGEYGSSFSGVDDNILKPTDVNQSDPKKDIYGTYDKIRFYGYDNTDVDRQTFMKITYKVDGAVMDRTYPIKTKPGDAVKVVGGNLYKLSVTIGNASEDIDFVIEDWIPNTLSVGDIFGEPVK